MSFVQYWKNSKHSCVDHKCSDDDIPIIGLFTGEEEFLHIKWIGERQENALEYDKYHSEGELVDLAFDEKREIILRYKEQKPESSVDRVYPGIQINSLTQAAEIFKAKEDNGKIYSRSVFLPSLLPIEMTFTSIFLTNHPFQGVLHSFLRHNQQWQTIEPFVEVSLDRLKPVRSLIDNISSSYYMPAVRSAINTFLVKMEGMNVDEYNVVQTALNEVQMQLVKTLQEKLVYSNYRGEGVNEKGQLQTYFQMGQDLVAMIGFSRELFHPEEQFDPRPFRTIITIYFINDQECNSRTVMRSY